MALYLHRQNDLKPIGGGAEQELKKEIQALNERIAELESRIEGMASKDDITNSQSITEPGMIMDAMQNNAAVAGSLSQKVDANKSSIQSVNSDLLSRISTANSNISTISNLLNRFTKGDGCVPMYYGDLNNITNTSIYNCAHSNTTHYPAKWESGYWSFVITLVHTNGSPYCIQVAIVMNASYAQRAATRYKLNNIWNDWAYITVGQ